MNFVPAKFLRLLNICLALTLGGLFVACLDIPSDPDTSGRIESIKVHVLQYDQEDSTKLKINPNDSAALVAVVYPDDNEDNLLFFWYEGKNLIGDGKVFPIPVEEDFLIPNALLVVDKQYNSRRVKFNVIQNAAPVLDSETIPSNGANITADENTPVQFQWKSSDTNDDKLTHILEIDSVQYNVGPLTKVAQSGFKPGEHSFRVIVTDSYGDADTLSWVSFEIIDPNAGAEP